MKVLVGVLALQGAFSKHAECIHKLQAKAVRVRTAAELECCDALIIPGGESTTMFKQLLFCHLTKPIQQFAQTRPVFGTCAGAILMSKKVHDSAGVLPLSLMDIEIKRNAYGRQNDSFSSNIPLAFSPQQPYNAIFIRAPEITAIGPEVQTIAELDNQPVVVQQGFCIAATCHPELTEDLRLHAYLLNLATRNKQNTPINIPEGLLLHQS